jgi:hypothetical protein
VAELPGSCWQNKLGLYSFFNRMPPKVRRPRSKSRRERARRWVLGSDALRWHSRPTRVAASIRAWGDIHSLSPMAVSISSGSDCFQSAMRPRCASSCSGVCSPVNRAYVLGPVLSDRPQLLGRLDKRSSLRAGDALGGGDPIGLRLEARSRPEDCVGAFFADREYGVDAFQTATDGVSANFNRAVLKIDGTADCILLYLDQAR